MVRRAPDRSARSDPNELVGPVRGRDGGLGAFVVSATRVFVCFDVDHDRDLHRRLVAKSGTAGLGITVSGGSEPFVTTDEWSERARCGIRGAERVLVICGEYTDASMGVAAELRIVREEEKPYLLLWGRRESMCTKPAGVKPAEAIYAWTPSTLHEQFDLMNRVAQREAAAKGMRRTAQARAASHAPVPPDPSHRPSTWTPSGPSAAAEGTKGA